MMMMMMMIMMMMNCFCGMVDRQKAFSLISSRDHCQRSSPSRISDTPRAGFEPTQNLSSDLVELSSAVVITTILRYHWRCHVITFCFKQAVKKWGNSFLTLASCLLFSFLLLFLFCLFFAFSFWGVGGGGGGGIWVKKAHWYFFILRGTSLFLNTTKKLFLAVRK